MGRRPHPLVQNFFDRGPKLGDKSNRYQHTCKRCGEAFLKGRIEALVTHLVRHCPNLTQAEQSWVGQQLQQQDLERPIRPSKRRHDGAFAGATAAVVDDYHFEFPPLVVEQQQSALETLAEVSGHYYSRETTEQTDDADRHQQIMSRMVAELLTESAPAAHPHGHDGAEEGLHVSIQATAGSDLHSADFVRPRTASRADLEIWQDRLLQPTSRLAETASAANQHLEDADHVRDARADGVTHPDLDGIDITMDAGPNMKGRAASPAPQLSWTEPVTSTGGLAKPQSDPTVAGETLCGSMTKKPRGRFCDVRRKEVSEIRKQGACIRCRMLKKPCSGETPCRTCTGVGSARIWKEKCVRTKLCDESTVWSRGVFNGRAKTNLTANSTKLRDTGTTGHVRMTLRGSTAPITLPMKQLSVEMSVQNDDESSVLTGQVGGWALTHEDLATDALGQYACDQAQHLVEGKAPVLGAIVAEVQRSVEGKDCETTTDGPKRSNARPQLDLLQHTLELWALNEILTMKYTDGFSLEVVAHTDAPHEVPHPAPGTHLETAHNDLLRAQLLGMMERRCSSLSRIVLNEIERRLLQRQQTSRFATFLSALLFLNAVERMSGYCSSPEAEEGHLPARGGDDAYVVSDNTSNNGHSHVNDQTQTRVAETTIKASATASTTWQQSEHFSDLLASLLRMRALPPRTTVTADGILASVREPALPTPDPESKEAAADWLDGLRLQARPLKERRDGMVPAPVDGVEAWQMRYIAKALLP